MRLPTILIIITLPLLASAQGTVPIGGGAAGIDDLQLVSLSGIDATLATVDDADGVNPALKVTLSKTDEQRRLLALEGMPAQSVVGSKAVALRYKLDLKTGEGRLALVVFDEAGNAWYKTGNAAPADHGFVDGRLGITSMNKAAFSRTEGDLDWDALDKVWIGIVIDGAAEGTFEMSGAHFTSEAYRPTHPLRITGDGAGKWSIGKDAAVTATLTTPDEGRDGQACMKLEFNFVGGRHMYLTPTIPVPAAELDGYTGLQFTYKATLPDGIEGLLVMLTESGGQYMATPMPGPSEDWVTITIPFADFELGSWSKDDNGQLDLGRINSIIIGTHGGATGDGGDGLIMVSDIEFAP